MRKNILVALLFALFFFAQAAVALTGELDFNSRYVWRGLAYSQGAVAQPQVSWPWLDYNFSVWGNYVLNKEPNQGQFNEVDLYLSQTGREWNNILLEPTLQFFLYPLQTSPNTGELSLKFSYPLGAARLYTTQNIDLVNYGGSYFADLGLSYDKEMNSIFTFSSIYYIAYGSTKFNETYIDLSKSALNLAGTDLALAWSTASGLNFRLHAAYTSILDKDLRDQIIGLGNQPDLFCTGLYITKDL